MTQLEGHGGRGGGSRVTASGTFEALAAELEETFARGPDVPLDDLAFEDLGLRVFRHQFAASAVYAAYCRARGATPESVGRWQDVPAVPASGFAHVELLSAPEAEAVFLTSGTTRGSASRGRHLVPRLSLYRASLLATFRRRVMPEGTPMPLLSLIPSPAVAPESSLSYMIGAVAETMASRAAWLADRNGLVEADAFMEAAADAAREGGPVLVTGTAFGLVHLLDGMRAEGRSVRLPVGSRIMETGGFKGRSREVSRASLRAAMEELLGVPPDFVVNEYGMTELLSQLYEPVLEEGAGAAGRHVPPPWLRVRALDPVTLEPVPPGTPGLLCFHDLANLGSVSVVLTEDVGTAGPDGVRLRGRTGGAEPRGCSLAVEELLSARGRTP